MSTQRYPLLFDEVILTDRHHDRFLLRDLEQLSEDQIWAERKLLELRLAELIFQRSAAVILGSDRLMGEPHPIAKPAWIRRRLCALQVETRRRQGCSA